jgi:hypothetical protein
MPSLAWRKRQRKACPPLRLPFVRVGSDATEVRGRFRIAWRTGGLGTARPLLWHWPKVVFDRAGVPSSNADQDRRGETAAAVRSVPLS